jgi:protein ImuB
VVESERPQAQVLWLNRAARKAGVAAGMRAGTARALSPELSTGVVSQKELADGVAELTALLRKFSARVEPSEEPAGLFWLDASGLLMIFNSLENWANQLRAALVAVKMMSGISVGFNRFSSAAVARALGGSRSVVFATRAEEDLAAAQVPLARLGLPADSLAALEQLGVQTLGQFLALPAGGISRRFGPEALRLRRLAAGELAAPLQPLAPEEPLALSLELDDAESDRARLTFLVKRLLDALLVQLAGRGQAAAALELSLGLKRSSASTAPETLRVLLRPAEATLDAAQLLGLVHLRLDALALSAGVTRVALSVQGAPATREQLEMHARRPRRDLDAAARAFARLRAAFGEDAVVRAKLENGHLPEARFSWEPLASLAPAQPREEAQPQLVRRLHARPVPLPPREAREPDGWLIRGLSGGRVEKLHGPHRVSGGWWQRELERDYYFAETSLGETLWIFYDRKRRRWLLQGAVV